MFRNKGETRQRFSLRKFAFGAASVLLGTFFVVTVSGVELPNAIVAKAAQTYDATTSNEFIGHLQTAQNGDTIQVSFGDTIRAIDVDPAGKKNYSRYK